MKGALWKISVTISEDAEKIISALLENIFGQTPAIYTDAKTGKTSASIYLTRISEWNSKNKRELQNALRRLREPGRKIDPARISAQKLPAQDWAESWKKHFQPIEIGDALLIKPSWSKKLSRKNQACVVLDPGLSFGTGQHATTLFCLEQLVRCRRIGQPQSFLDIGTGSGILAISAAKLGYSPVNAFDFDRDAIRVSHANAKRNDVAGQVHPICCDLAQLPAQSKIKFDVICANLIYDVLLSGRERIVNRLAPGGSLILAGILKTQFAQVQKTYEKMGMKLQSSRVGKEWRSGKFIFQGEAERDGNGTPIS